MSEEPIKAGIYRVERYKDLQWVPVDTADDPDSAIGIAYDDAGKELTFEPHIFIEGDGMLSVDQEEGEPVYRIVFIP